MTLETLRQDVRRLHERVTGTPYYRNHFQQARRPLPTQVDPIPYLQQKLDQLKEIVDQRLSQGRPGREVHWVPVAEVLEGAKDYEIRLELPGLSKKDIEVHAGENVIRITGERKFEPQQDRKMLCCERIYGRFERWITLPFRVHRKDLELEFEAGILQIHVTKKEASSTSLESVEIS